MLLEMVDADIISKNNWLARDQECRERFEFRVLVTCDRFSLQQQRWMRMGIWISDLLAFTSSRKEFYFP